MPRAGRTRAQDDDAGGFRLGRRRSRLHAPHPPFRRRPVRWIWAKHSSECGRLRTSVRHAIMAQARQEAVALRKKAYSGGEENWNRAGGVSSRPN